MVFFSKSPEWLWEPPSLLFSCYQVSSQGTKRPRPDVQHSLPASAEVDPYLLPHPRLHSVVWQNYWSTIKLKGCIRNQWSPKTRHCLGTWHEGVKKTTRIVSPNSVDRDTNQAPIEHRCETITYSRGAGVGRGGGATSCASAPGDREKGVGKWVTLPLFYVLIAFMKDCASVKKA